MACFSELSFSQFFLISINDIFNIFLPISTSKTTKKSFLSLFPPFSFIYFSFLYFFILQMILIQKQFGWHKLVFSQIFYIPPFITTACAFIGVWIPKNFAGRILFPISLDEYTYTLLSVSLGGWGQNPQFFATNLSHRWVTEFWKLSLFVFLFFSHPDLPHPQLLDFIHNSSWRPKRKGGKNLPVPLLFVAFVFFFFFLPPYPYFSRLEGRWCGVSRRRLRFEQISLS